MGDCPPLDDEVIAQFADQSFQEYDVREAAQSGASRGEVPKGCALPTVALASRSLVGDSWEHRE